MDTVSDFTSRFALLMGDVKPFAWQQRLFTELQRGNIPSSLDLPTGVGKTAIMPIWLIARAAGASVPRRLVYVVDRRAVVDQASAIAQNIADRLAGPEAAAASLRKDLGLREQERLPVSTLRGQLADNRLWLNDPTIPAIVVGTIDMVGSRLLFEGYGVSRGMRPCHAGLLGTDALIVLDEAHLTPAFAALMRAIAKEQHATCRSTPLPPLHFLCLTATGRTPGKEAFRLTPDEKREPAVARRITAAKHLCWVACQGDNLAENLAEHAVRLAPRGTPARVLVYCDRREVARAVHQALKKRLGSDQPLIELLVGARRVRERERLAQSPVYRRFSGDDGCPATAPAFLVATAAGEVGVDLDADHLVCDLVPFERMVQRLGRVNRRGLQEQAEVRVLTTNQQGKAGQQAARAYDLLGKLPGLPGGTLDASPGALDDLRRRPDLAERILEATTPEPLSPALTRPLVEAWSLTSLADHPGRPMPEPWLRGWVEEEPQTQVIWRCVLPWPDGQDLPDPRQVEAFFEHAAPHRTEVLDAESRKVARTLIDRAAAVQKRDTLPDNVPAVLVLDLAGALCRRPDGRPAAFRLGELAALKSSRSKSDHEFDRLLRGGLAVVNRALGGLDESGLLDGAADDPPPTLDSGWTEEELANIGYRIRRLDPGDFPERENEWREVYRLEARRSDDDDEDLPVWVVEERLEAKGPGPGSERAVSARPQSLDEHQAWVKEEVGAVADTLGLSAGYREALQIAALLHDSGKGCGLWQRYAGNRNAQVPLAKFAGRGDPTALRVGGYVYRHEFGSLSKAEADPRLLALPQGLRDLALHLVASHHGFARPLVAPADPDTPPSLCQRRATEAALRFARLQRCWGPWGLAWWEAIFRAADWRASARLERQGA